MVVVVVCSHGPAVSQSDYVGARIDERTPGSDLPAPWRCHLPDDDKLTDLKALLYRRLESDVSPLDTDSADSDEGCDQTDSDGFDDFIDDGSDGSDSAIDDSSGDDSGVDDSGGDDSGVDDSSGDAL
eukprot:COSAG03_NODE_3906_length_1765_cov_38.109844_2_plen_127_part_00